MLTAAGWFNVIYLFRFANFKKGKKKPPEYFLFQLNACKDIQSYAKYRICTRLTLIHKSGTHTHLFPILPIIPKRTDRSRAQFLAQQRQQSSPVPAPPTPAVFGSREGSSPLFPQACLCVQTQPFPESIQVLNSFNDFVRNTSKQ